MILLLLLAGLILLNLLIELVVVGLSVRFFVWEVRRHDTSRGFFHDMWAMGVILLLLLIGHFFQIAVWAAGFIWNGEFDSFRTAFYHSAVNYAALGYGDIVMSEDWRLMGGIEAAVGVMMFGVSAALLFSVLGKLTRLHLLEVFSSNGEDLDEFNERMNRRD